MKSFLLLFSLITSSSILAQSEGYIISGVDTIELKEITFKKTVAFHLDEAIVLIDHKLFMQKLQNTRKGVDKQYKARIRMLERQMPGVVMSVQIKSYQKQMTVLDSVFRTAKQSKADTFHVHRRTFSEAGSWFGDFLPYTIEAGQCMVLDLNNQKQQFLIRKKGSKKTGEWTGTGSSFYYIPGATTYFLSKMDWVS